MGADALGRKRTHTDAVSAGDWGKYEKLCDKNLTVSDKDAGVGLSV